MADEPTHTQSSKAAYNNKEVFPVVLKPVWEPFGTEAEEAVGRVLKDACWPASGPKARKYRIVVSSFLKAVQDVYLRQKYRKDDNKPLVHLGIRRRNDAWSPYPLVGKDVGIKIVDELLPQFDAKLVEGSGSSNLVQDEQDKWSSDPKMSMYVIDLSKASEFSTGPVAVWCRTFDSIMCSKGDEL